MSDKHYPGKGCTCEAFGQCECGCDADWRSTREVELEAMIANFVEHYPCGTNPHLDKLYRKAIQNRQK